MQEVIERLSSELSSASWTLGTPIDRMDHYMKRFRRSTRITTGPPSPASDRLMIRAELTADPETGQPRIRGRCIHDLSEIGLALMKELPKDQIGHRSRPANLASGRLQMNEMTRRVTKLRANIDNLRRYSVPSNISEEILGIKRDAVLSRIKFDPDWVSHYISEHKDSSVAPGIKWAGLPDPHSNRSFWVNWMDTVKEGLELSLDGKHRFDTPLNVGMRMRADQSTEAGEAEYLLDVTRTRIVTFTTMLSSVFAFMPEKKGFYRDVFEGCLDVFDIRENVLFPPVHGGEVYIAAEEGLKDNEPVDIVLGDDYNMYRKGEQFAYDGANWETQVGTLLGEPFYGTKTYFGGAYHVPSGVFDTTLDDTIASLWVAGKYLKDDGSRQIADVFEREEKDENVNFMLGLRYVDDPSYPRLQGLKLVQDKATSTTILPRGRLLELENDYDEEQKLRWYLGYQGVTIDGESILSLLEPIDGDDWKSGTVDQVIAG
jgi:hypothetical protein